MFRRRILKRKAYAFAGATVMLCAPAVSHAFAPFVVKDIRVEGIQRLDPGTIFNYLPVKVGQTFTNEQAGDAIRRLYASGFFNDVDIRRDGDVLVVAVQERPTIASLSFNGMHTFEAKTITAALNKVNFGEGQIFDESMLEKAVYELKQQYLAKGLYGVEVTTTVTPLPRNRVGVAFNIFEGSQARIEGIRIIGNKAFSESTLLDQFAETTPGWLTWFTDTDKYSREKLQADIEAVRSYYLDRGYLQVTIDPPDVSISPDRKSIYLTLTVHEGDIYKVSGVHLAGNLLGLNSELQGLVKIKAGDTFSASNVNATVKGISDYLGQLGYAFANVNPNPQVDRDHRTVDMTFYVDPSRRVYVRQINIGGNTRTRDEVIRREMRQQEAAWYNGGEVQTSKDRLNRLGYFDTVNVSTEPVPGTADQVDVNVDVKEKPTGLINIGAGYGSADKVILSAGISQDNVFGSGQNLTLQFETGASYRTVVLSQTDPYWTLNGISRTNSLYYRTTEEFDNNDGEYKVRTYGTGINFGVPISETDRIYVGGNLERNQVELYSDSPAAYNSFVDQYGDATNAAIFNVGWSKDTRNSALVPTKGSYTSLKASFSTWDLQYYMFSGQQQLYFPLGNNFTLSFNGLVDWGVNYGSNDFPVIKDVYAGGIGTVRGFESSSLGPRDTTTGDYLGGAHRMVGSMQLYLPFPGAGKEPTLRWFLFTDAGRVTPGSGMECTAGKADDPVTDPCGWRYSAGVGLSWDSPMGPLQLSYGHPLNAKSGDDLEQFQFQIGTSF